ncbi:unnamed protein product [Staurois parvus]|uniref:Uncharacterized protein n=1 Tax=Staurois parvus TaxID=386267 RepID=A0ABN9FI92_9NEOB|nr:unnamed protein product [Staurois parvus]
MTITLIAQVCARLFCRVRTRVLGSTPAARSQQGSTPAARSQQGSTPADGRSLPWSQVEARLAVC